MLEVCTLCALNISPTQLPAFHLFPCTRDIGKVAGHIRGVLAVDPPRTVGSQREPLSILADALIRHAGDAIGESPLDAIMHKTMLKSCKSKQPGVGILEDIRGGVQAAWRDVASAVSGVRETVEKNVAVGGTRALEDALKALQGAFNGTDTEYAVERIDDAFARIDDALAHEDARIEPCRRAPEEAEMLVRVVFELLGRPLDARAERMLRVMFRLGAGGVLGVVLAVLRMLSAVKG